MMVGERISDMITLPTLAAGDMVPVVQMGGSVNYKFDLGAKFALYPTSVALASSGASAGIGFIQAGTGAVARTLQDKGREIVSVRDFMAAPDGTVDNTVAFQNAQNSLANGGIILVPKSANPYRVSRVDITNPNITIRLENGATIKKFGSGGVSGGPDAFGERGIFCVLNFLSANFVLEGEGPGSIIDMNCEGPIGIGVAGRIPNQYAELTVSGTKGISAVGNSAVFALRSSHITIRNLQLKNSSECGALFRNCSDTLVENVLGQNIAHYVVEWSYPTAGSDQGSGTMPDLSRNYVRNLTAIDVNDWAIGTGNGAAVGGGGNGTTNPTDHEATDIVAIRCQRSINLEFATASAYYDGFKWSTRCYDVLQGCVGLISVKGSEGVLLSRNSGGAAPTAGLKNGADEYAEIYALVVSGPLSDNNFAHVEIIDNRNTKAYAAADGAMTAGDATFTSATAAFVAADVGRWIGVIGAGPDGICHQARIASLNGAAPTTSVELERPAVTTVSGARYAYGAALRRGVVVNGGGNLTLTGRVLGGIASGLTDEPDAAGVYIESATAGRVDTSGLTVIAPTTLGTTPTGVLLDGALTGSGKFRPGEMSVRGFTAGFVGTYTNQASVESPTTRHRPGASAANGPGNPSAAIDTYGTAVVFTPRAGRWDMIDGVALTFASVSAETVIVELRSDYFDGGHDELLVTSTTNQTVNLTADDIANLMRDNSPVRLFSIRSQSSKASSTATIAPAFLATGP